MQRAGSVEGRERQAGTPAAGLAQEKEERETGERKGEGRGKGGRREEAIFFSAATPFRFVFFRRHAIFFFLSVSFRFSSEVVPRNPGHATHFTKGNENPLGNKLGGGPGGGARTPPSVNLNLLTIGRHRHFSPTPTKIEAKGMRPSGTAPAPKTMGWP